jgi:hypothetical protein
VATRGRAALVPVRDTSLTHVGCGTLPAAEATIRHMIIDDVHVRRTAMTRAAGCPTPTPDHLLMSSGGEVVWKRARAPSPSVPNDRHSTQRWATFAARRPAASGRPRHCGKDVLNECTRELLDRWKVTASGCIRSCGLARIVRAGQRCSAEASEPVTRTVTKTR